MKKSVLSWLLVCLMSFSLICTHADEVLADSSDAGQEAFALADQQGEEEFGIIDENEDIVDPDDIIDLDQPGESQVPDAAEDVIDLDQPGEFQNPDQEEDIGQSKTEESPELIIKDGPADIWEAIYVLEESTAVYTPEEYETLLPQIEEIIYSSPAYKEGTMEYKDGILFWWSDDRQNGYSPIDRAKMNGYSDALETSPELEQLYEEIREQIKEETEEETQEITPAQAGGTGYDVGVFLPYSGFSGDVFELDESLGERVAYFTRGEITVYKAKNATIDRLAELIQSCTVVIIGSHGYSPGGRFGIASDTGLTTDDYKDSHAWYSGKSDQADQNEIWVVDGTVITNHMKKNAGNCFVYLDNCMSMKTDRLCTPLRAKGVDVLLGYSESVSSGGASVFSSCFFEDLGWGDTVEEAFRYTKRAIGCEWDPLFHNFTLEQAQQACVAFPIIVSDQDTYPGAGNVNDIQYVKSTWKLPHKPSESADPTWGWTTYTARKGVSVSITANVETTENYKSVSKVSGSLPSGMTYTKNTNSLVFSGTPTKKGLYKSQFKITTSSGKVYTNNVEIMVKDTRSIESSQNITFTAPNVNKWETGRFLTLEQQYYQALDFGADDATYSMRIVSGYLPYTLYYGFSDGSTGYIRSETFPGTSGKYYATIPGTYTASLEIVSYSGTVYNHVVRVNVKPAHKYVYNHTYDYYPTQYQEFKANLYRDFYKDELTDGSKWAGNNSRKIEVVSGSLPDGMYVTNSYEKPCGIYGAPTQWGVFDFTVDVYTYSDIYEYKIKLTVKEVTKTGQCGNSVYWSLSGNQLDIYGYGDMWDYPSDYPEYDTYKDEIKKVNIQKGVTSIGSYAFYQFKNLDTATIASSVLKINDGAFIDCYALSTLSLPYNLTDIGESAFRSCASIPSLSLPSGLKTIGELAFCYCFDLTEVEIPNNVATIGRRAFFDCQNLESVAIGSNVSLIEREAFAECEKLKNITFSGAAPKIEYDAFFNVVATAYYPAGNTWTTDVRKDYEGKITWKSVGAVPATGLAMDRTKAEIATESHLQLTAIPTPSYSTEAITWSSSNSKIASVDNTGWVYAKKYGTVTITAKTESGKKAVCKIQTRFYDVNDSGKSYFKAVYWAVDNGITKCSVNFRPDEGVTRGEFTAFLYRMAGSPAVTKYATNFKDVNSSTKFYTEISWAVNKGIIKGFSDGTFRPNDGLTRGQAAIMIWRYAGKPKVSTKTSPFKDVAAQNTDTCKAIVWGNQNGIIKGYSDGTFRKDQACTRANVVTFLYRYKMK